MKDLKDLLFFDKMLTPRFITFIYWLLLAAVVVSGLGMMFVNFSFGSFLSGLFMMVIGAVVVRIWCELMIVLFKMNDALQELRNK
ncbi:MAG TPA: DUF4282 domain-containing protein [Guyparkeria sp.]|nr:DUF4282 domain-containing protein [Guyparkeria sp.]